MTDEQAPLGPIQQIENTLADMDPSAMVVGFATVVDWLEQDGSRQMTVLHTTMPAWQLFGMLTFARQHDCWDDNLTPEEIAELMCDLDEEEDF